MDDKAVQQGRSGVDAAAHATVDARPLTYGGYLRLEELLAAGTAVRFRAEGGSMDPAIRHGDVVTLEPLGTAPLSPGEVVAVLVRG